MLVPRNGSLPVKPVHPCLSVAVISRQWSLAAARCAEGWESDDSPDRPSAGPAEGTRDRAYERADSHPLVCVISRGLPPRTARRGESSASAVHRTAATSWLECPFPVMLCARNRCARLRLGTI